MRQAIVQLIVIAGVFLSSNAIVGFPRSYAIGYGAFTIMAAFVSLTFLWLWVRRATPLAMGMFFSWAGAASVIGWWWLYSLDGRPAWMLQSPVFFGFLSIYFVGAILHFQVIWQSFGAHGRGYYAPVVLSLFASVAVEALV